ncbi:MAG TPA: hypothetical protein VFW60_02055 [Rhodanobacteraceae bacterium]|nr:hypothetical protein [Rhodanobacteraceae bacterium]
MTPMTSSRTHSQTIEATPAFCAGTDDADERVDDVRQAWMAEQVRIQHIRKALACTRSQQLRNRWQVELADSHIRMHVMEQALWLARRPTGGGPAGANDPSDGCLLDAMELAKANGDFSAAEAVAVECMALVELRCLQIQRGRAQFVAQTMIDPECEGVHKEQVEHEKYQ